MTEKLTGAVVARKAIFDAMADSVIIIDDEAAITDSNYGTTNLFGFVKAELIDYKIDQLLSDKSSAEFAALFASLNDDRQRIAANKGIELVAQKKNGERFYALFSISQYRAAGKLQYVCSFKDISEQVKARLDMEFCALHDPLTQLESRRAFEQSFEFAISTAIREDK